MDYVLTNKIEEFKGENYKIYKKKIDDGFTYCYPEVLRDYELDPERIDTLSVLPGVGKTHWAIEKMLEGLKNKDYIYLFMSPTVKLLDEVYLRISEKLNSKNLKRVKKIHGTGIKGDRDLLSISKAFTSELLEAERGTIFLITHALYMALTDMPRKKHIFAIFDEAQSFGITTEEFSPKEKDLELLKQHIALEVVRYKMAPRKIKGDFNSEDIEIFFKVHGKEKEISNHKKLHDTKYIKKYLGFLKTTIHKKLDVYMVKKQSGDGYSFFSFSSPKHTFEGFKRVYLMGAFFDGSELYHVLKKHHFLESKNIKLNSRINAISKRFNELEIIPIMKELRTGSQGDNYLSKNLLATGLVYKGKERDFEKLCEDFTDTFYDYSELVNQGNGPKTLLAFRKAFLKEDKTSSNDYLEKHIKKLIKPLRKKYSNVLSGLFDHLLYTSECHFKDDTKALCVVNKIYLNKKSDYIEPENFITTSVHGLNSYSHMNTLVFLAGIRPDPTVISFYEQFIKSYSWQDNLLAANILQAVCRLNVRDVNSSAKTFLYVPTYETALRVQEVLYSALNANSPERLEILDSRSKILNMTDIVKFDRKSRPVKESLLIKNENGEIIGKTSTRLLCRNDEIYRKLDNAKMANTKMLKTTKLHKSSNEYKILLDEKDKIETDLKARKQELKKTGFIS